MNLSAWTCRTAAALLLGTAALVPATAGAAEGDLWTLQEMNLNDAGTGIYKSVTIVSQHFDSTGGAIEVNLDGDDGLHTCPGGSETLRFSWHFMTDVFQLREGSDVVVEVSGEPLHLAAPCGGHITAQSRVTAGGVKGSTAGLPDDAAKLADADRFYAIKDTIDTRFAFGSKDEGGITSTTRTIHLDVYEPPADRPNAYFTVQFGFFGAGGMQVAYVYKKGTDSPLPH
jgi:hypothetical protein